MPKTLSLLFLHLARSWTWLLNREGKLSPPFEVKVRGQRLPSWFQMPSMDPRFTHVPTMLTGEEKQLLSWATREYYGGQGCVVDAGPFLGGSTAPLCVGLQDNRRTTTKQGVVHSFDQFLNDSSLYPPHWEQLGYEVAQGDSFLHIFERLMAPFAEYLCVHAGDLCHLSFEAGPIEILFVDVAKTWGLNASVVSKFFRHLIPGRSLVIHQDYLHCYSYWLVITMWFFRKYFVFRGQVEEGHSVVFQCTRTIPEDLLDTDLKSLPLQKKKAAFEWQLERLSGWQRTEVMIGYVRMLVDEGEMDQARSVVQLIPAEAYNHPCNQRGLQFIPAHLLDRLPNGTLHGLPADFDEKAYFRVNPDVASAGMRGALHFVLYGKTEQRPLK